MWWENHDDKCYPNIWIIDIEYRIALAAFSYMIS